MLPLKKNYLFMAGECCPLKKIKKKKIYLWQESVVIVPKHQKLHFTPKSANSATDGG